MKRLLALVLVVASMSTSASSTTTNPIADGKQPAARSSDPALAKFLSGGPRSSKIVKPNTPQKGGVDGFLNGSARSTKIVRPADAKR